MAVLRTSHVDLKVNGEGAYAFVAQPDDNATHPGVVLIQEWWGIEPHIRDLAQRLAAEGFVVAVPDLYHGKVVTEPDEAGKMMMMVTGNLDRAIKEIIGALDTVKAMQNVEPKKPGLVGFCMGGFLAFKVATHYSNLGALVPFYAAGYDATPEDAAKVNAPILAFYGNSDPFAPNEQREKTEQVYKAAGKNITVKVYHAGHAFMNPSHGDYVGTAAEDAWPRMVNFLKEHLK
jgi:carboxymethylenebutenolidase